MQGLCGSWKKHKMQRQGAWSVLNAAPLSKTPYLVLHLTICDHVDRDIQTSRGNHFLLLKSSCTQRGPRARVLIKQKYSSAGQRPPGCRYEVIKWYLIFIHVNDIMMVCLSCLVQPSSVTLMSRDN